MALFIGCISICSGLFNRGNVVVSDRKFGGTNYSASEHPLQLIQNSEAAIYVDTTKATKPVLVSGSHNDSTAYGAIYLNAGSAWGTTDFHLSDHDFVTIDFDISAAEYSEISYDEGRVPNFNVYLLGRNEAHQAISIAFSLLKVKGHEAINITGDELPEFDIESKTERLASDLSTARVTYVFRNSNSGFDLLIFINGNLVASGTDVVDPDIRYIEGIRIDGFDTEGGEFIIKNMTVNTFSKGYKGAISNLCNAAFAVSAKDETLNFNGCSDIKRFVRR